MEVDGKLLTYLKEVEAAAEDVLADKQEIVDLDRKRHRVREALRAVEKSDENKLWMAAGNTFIKMPTETAVDMMKAGKLFNYLFNVFDCINLRNQFLPLCILYKEVDFERLKWQLVRITLA